MAEVVKVKRDGPKGYHLIAKAKYDANPGAYELYDAPSPPEPVAEIVTDAPPVERVKRKYTKRS